MSFIKKIYARQIFDSRGNPTIEVDVVTTEGVIGSSSVPSGASRGKYEAVELRDNGMDYFGKGVIKAIGYINGILCNELVGTSVFKQNFIDQYLIQKDDTPNKNKLGSNALLGVSLAIAKAASNTMGVPLYKYLGGINASILPVPMINIINGGMHSYSPISFQEFMIVPIKFNSFSMALKAGIEIFQQLKNILQKRKLSTSVGDEGGFAPNFKSIEDVLDTIVQAIEETGYKLKEQIMLALDCAASEFYKEGLYDYTIFEGIRGSKLTTEQQVEYLANLCYRYPIQSIEDGMDQNDWVGWKKLTNKIGSKVQLVGDDLFVTNTKFLEKGISEGIANSILVKVNQIGTLTETMKTINKAQDAGYTTVISHRSGETEDHIISDLSVAFNTGQIKTGSVSRSDRMAKYNQLLRIEEKLGKFSSFPQWKTFRGRVNK
ncbi:phosphopyruvate hydratase [Candidatus Uzinura diaspidicola str. ASNER]|uniref:Enolase n=1 Tax=Candidatus Uzinura diaspidicola str. ASNER TaxID=1133592 RepID=L7VN06_9FLAO|nr:phosphopyruvate hydratase [Candidatus Uzinura diaspidicola str. ASNER]